MLQSTVGISTGVLFQLINQMQPATYKKHSRPPTLAHLVPGLSSEGVELMTSFLQFDPTKRITAKDAMEVCFGLRCYLSLPREIRR